MQKIILSADKDLRFEHSNTHSSLKHLSTIHSELSWLRIWDMALDHGVQGTRNTLCLFNTLSRPLFGNRLCPCCETPVVEDLTYLARAGVGACRGDVFKPYLCFIRHPRNKCHLNIPHVCIQLYSQYHMKRSFDCGMNSSVLHFSVFIRYGDTHINAIIS